MVLAEQILRRLENLGLREYILPFLLIWAIFYGVLRSIKIFDEQGRIDVVVSVIAAFISTFYTPFGGQLSTYMINLFGSISLLLVTMLGFFLLTGMMMGKSGRDKIKKYKGRILVGVAVAVVFLFISYGGGQMLGVEVPFISPGDIYLILIIGGIIAFMAWTMGAIGRGEWAVISNDGEILRRFGTKERAESAAGEGQEVRHITEA
ncbi:MAG: hypothetical protein SVV03_03600 [Candidatus Nanohaloarchaea archaeon]|nr:hypothetical protein [Candidatus Nanohaloarchaea archaeon]